MNRRLRTLFFGAIPVMVSAALVGADTLPVFGDSLRVPYAAEGPGPVFNTLGDYDGEKIIDISGLPVDPTDGALDMTTVSVAHNMTLPQAFTRMLTTDDTFVPLDVIIPPGQTAEEVQETNEREFSSSESAATMAAFRHLGLPLTTVVEKTVPGSGASGVINPGDEIVAVAGQQVTSPTAVTELVRAQQPGQLLTVTVKRHDTGAVEDVQFTLGKDTNHGDTPLAGMMLVAEPADGARVNYNLSGVGGPSAGLIFSLAVVDKLEPGSLTGGHKIAGTGTMSPDGTVGPIGGIAHKVQAASDAGAELFLSPAENCAEAVSRYDGPMTVVRVSSLEDAIGAIDAFKRGDTLDTCSR
ncbi:PDZ domain-containing protein [Corynebacterium choanae]|uniref:YlbL family protein n=1 Tax=Corynebacterium choanae TaxID=1862358 RepID=UPI000F4EC111|nr:PDZ domain-containing protein [Corynebacterium choanae]